MIKLIIDNSESKILGLTVKEFSELKELVSYTLDPQAQYFSRSYGSAKKSLLTKRGEFPTGLLYLVEDWLKSTKAKCEIVDSRVRPESLKNRFNLSMQHNPYPEQTNAALACLRSSRGIVSAPTGSGKSAIIALIIQNLQVKTLVVVPSLELKRQLSASLTLGFGSDRVGPNRDIWVENIDSLGSKELNDYSCIIIDEFHHAAAKTYRTLNRKSWNKVFYRFGLTATPFRSRDNESILLESVLSKIIYTIDYETAVAQKYIVPAEAYYINIPGKSSIEYGNYSAAYSDLITNNGFRNDILRTFLVKSHENSIATLCLVKEILHGNNLTSDKTIGFVNGQEDNRYLITAFNERMINVLVGTTGVIGEGVDTKPCEMVIIASPVKSRNLFMQMCGRAFRTYPGKEMATIILIKDNSHKWFKTAFKEQVKILQEEYNIIPVELKLDLE